MNSPAKTGFRGVFDYVDLGADVSDLADDARGPAVYAGILKPGGVLAARVPGALGCLGIQDVRDMLALLPAAVRSAATLEILLQALPASHRLRRGPSNFDLTDPTLFVAPRPNGMAVRDVAVWANDHGMSVEAFRPPARYDPIGMVETPVLRELFAALSPLDRWVVAELLAGDMAEHHIVARRQDVPVAGEAFPKSALPRSAGPRSAGVKSQYEAFPYPTRDPDDEQRRLLVGTPSDLAEINHYVFGGRRDFSQPFRVLVAGGGTGDATIMLAQQLANASPGAGAATEVVHLDLSEASIAVARARARVRNLDNVRFVSGSLLDLERLGLGLFDYADCCGVLHHLPEPLAGLRQLIGSLAPGGGLGLMLYGTLGRTGVYHLQEILRLIAPPDLGDEKRLERTRLLLDALPESNWLRRNPSIHDHRVSDAGRFDLLLHAIDRAYRVPEVYELCAAAGLRIVTFLEPVQYDPDALGAPPKLRRLLAGLDQPARAAFAELLTGRRRKHVFQAVRADNAVAPPDPADTTLIPILRDMDPAAAAKGMPAGGQIQVRQRDATLSLPVPPLAKAIVQRIDGQRRTADIVAGIRGLRPDLDEDAVMRQFAALYSTLNGINRMLLSARPLYPSSRR